MQHSQVFRVSYKAIICHTPFHRVYCVMSVMAHDVNRLSTRYPYLILSYLCFFEPDSSSRYINSNIKITSFICFSLQNLFLDDLIASLNLEDLHATSNRDMALVQEAYITHNLILKFKVIMLVEFLDLRCQMDIQEIWEGNLLLIVLKSLERLIKTRGLAFRALLTKKTHNKIWQMIR